MFYNSDNEEEILNLYMSVLKIDSQKAKTKTEKIDVVLIAIMGYAYQAGMQKQAIDGYEKLLRMALTKPKVKNDVPTLNKELKKFSNGIARSIRSNKWEGYIKGVLDQAIEDNQDVIWRARVQADGFCLALNGKVMPATQFRELWPVHTNCMCTPELIPKGYKVRSSQRLTEDELALKNDDLLYA